MPDGIDLTQGIGSFALAGFEIALAVLAVIVIGKVLDRAFAEKPGTHYRIHLLKLLIAFFALIAVIIAIPVSAALRGQLLSLLGILLSAAIALSSTTFIGNLMAGVMLRAVGSFRPGDFVRVGEHFGRVTEMDLLHTEIQTEDRDLTTLPNLFLVTQPVKVVRASGTIISVEVSLGYDVSRDVVERALLRAGEAAGLKDPFVQIMLLGDFSINYRLAGLLEEVKRLIAARSLLRAKTLDALHAEDIEIVSPNFMNTRALAPEFRAVPDVVRSLESASGGSADSADTVAFDKADQAASVEEIRKHQEAITTELAALEHQLTEAGDGERGSLETEIAKLREQSKALAEQIAKKEEELSED